MANFGNPGQGPGLEAWRIENLEPVAQEGFNGAFHTGDSYILLHTIQSKSGSFDYDLFFWLGKESSQDERGACAYQTVALDDLLGGRPEQHREVQEHESPKFMALFKEGIQYLEGGVASGFRKVDRDAYDTRLFHIKGKRNVRCVQVEPVASSLNEGDVFLLDVGKFIYQWNGQEANRYEKFKALEVATKIRNEEHGAKSEIVVLESGTDDNDESFWTHLGGDRSAVKTAEEGGSDDLVKREKPKLFRISDASGSMEFTLEHEGKLQRDFLDSDDCFILDTGTEVAVWIGKGANDEERKQAMQNGMTYLEQQGRPDWTPLSTVKEGTERPHFKAFFGQWDPPKVYADPAEAKEAKAQVELQASEVFKRTERAEEEMVDDGDGSVQVWRIEDFDKVPIPESQYGEFFQGDSYIVLYSYKVGSKDAWIIYFWQGRDSSSDERATSALMAVDMDDQLGGDPTQVRVVQGKEPQHFLRLFRGRMVVRSGGRASAFKNRNDTDSYDTDGIELYHVRGTNENNTRAVQVDEVAQSLNSGDCFVLLTPGTMYLWIGAGANDHEIEVAKNISARLKMDREEVDVPEGEEPDAFWEAIGGQAEYPKTSTLETGEHEPRLFEISDKSGELRAEEIFDYHQDDLCQDDVFILDCFDTVFVWVGHGARREERDGAFKLALDFVASGSDGRGADTPIFKVTAGVEPPNFTCHFLGWDTKLATDFTDPYAAKMAALGVQVGPSASAAAAGGAAAEPERITADSVGYRSFSNSASYADLKARSVDNVDPTKREQYLSDAEFQEVFGMDKAAFNKLAAWKQKQKKKETGLF